MREHMGLFRGKATGDGTTWLTGNLLVYGDECQIWHDTDNGKWNYAVDPNTVGECTGLTDQNGKLIFEGDIIRAYNGEIFQVRWFEKYAKFAVWKPGIVFGGTSWNMAEIIGNIHDNPELMGGADNG